MRSLIKISLALLGFALASADFLAAQGARSGPLAVGADDAARLGRGETVIRMVDDPRKLSLVAQGDFAAQLRSRIASLKPNYLSEVMLSIPYKKGAIETLAAALSNVKGYCGIDYYSKRQKRTYPLFDKMEVKARRSEAGGEVIEAWQHMDPFSQYGGVYRYRLKASSTGPGNELFFSGENTSPLSYEGVQAVSPGDFLWMLYAFPSGDRILFYGVGGVRAFDLFGVLRDRLEVSFIGRIEAFFGYMSKQLKEDA